MIVMDANLFAAIGDAALWGCVLLDRQQGDIANDGALQSSCDDSEYKNGYCWLCR